MIGLQLLGWCMYAAMYYFSLGTHQPFPNIALRQTFVAAGLGLGVSSLLGWGYRQWRVSQLPPTPKTLAILLSCLGLGLAWHQCVEVASEWVNPFVGPIAPYLGLQGTPLLRRMEAFPLILLLWSGLYLGIMHWREQRRHQERLLQADAEAQRARLRALRYQLNPHFFFNALNTIGALADEAPGRVKDAVRELSGFLRYTLLDDEALEAPLRDEVSAIEHYLAVEKIRFEEDLQVEIDVAPEAGRLTVPSFLVLPLVENAVKHGHHTSPMPLRVRVTGTVSDDALVVEVANTGHWREPRTGPEGTDTGLDNVRARLESQYPDRHRFTITDDDEWVRACIEIDTDALDRHA